MNCPVCQTQIDVDVNVCPQCNSDLEALKHVEALGKKFKTQKVSIIIISIFLVIFALMGILSFVSNNSTQSELKNLKSENAKLSESVTTLQTSISGLNSQIEDLKKKRSEQLAKKAELDAMVPKIGSNYKVKKGDTLWDIAQAAYGNAFLWGKIASANNISEPKLLQINKILQIK
ncbi:MAG: LysM peptidoglycan-binding domain-containing protein [Salinivirgaceae bacterium]|nr:LysM peptidoglycan-binding domain-containing protein [Salinivirgaceae bacterium]